MTNNAGIASFFAKIHAQKNENEEPLDKRGKLILTCMTINDMVDGAPASSVANKGFAMPFSQPVHARIPYNFRRQSTFRLLAAALSLSAAFSPVSASAEGITLKVFGGSSLDVLAPRETPEVQAKIKEEVVSGFLKEHPEVSAVEWDAQGPQSGSLQRLMTAKLSNQEMDLIACSAYWVNGAYVRRGLLRPITDEIQPFAANVDPASIGAFNVNGKVYGVPITSLSTSTIFYNVDLFKKLGIPTPPTYDDLKAAVPKLQEAGVIPLLH